VAARARLYGHVARGDIGDVGDAVVRRGVRRGVGRATRVVAHLARGAARHGRTAIGVPAQFVTTRPMNPSPGTGVMPAAAARKENSALVT